MKKMKKIAAVALSAAMALGLCACGDNASNTTQTASNDGVTVKAGFICLHDENSTYDLNFINGAKSACEAMGIEYIIKTNIPEGAECQTAAEELVDAGCNFVFADSFGHEDYIIEAAKEFPEVQFAHATGTKAHTEGLSNFHNAFASIYEGRYLAGITAGLKLNEMIENGQITADQAKMGYVGAYPYAEVVSGYTSFYLGAKSVCPTVTMDVTYTSSWYDETAEKEGANKLINNGCVLISQHADSMGAPTACENAGVPNVSYNGSTLSACPNTFLVSSRIDWAPYFTYAMTAIKNGETFATDYVGTIATGSVCLTDLSGNVAEGTADAIETAKAALANGTLHVFDTATFTVGGSAVTEYMADVDSDPAYEGDHNVIVDGHFAESADGFRSAPYFDLRIDGITELQ
ncbi:MAG: BMP family ABC transporter substrate-binding protein [Lachnospiraceae bacterium]|nr:BMP family ABC transporter substrate-binding protein [Candidatus Merdinaster equi]